MEHILPGLVASEGKNKIDNKSKKIITLIVLIPIIILVIIFIIELI